MLRVALVAATVLASACAHREAPVEESVVVTKPASAGKPSAPVVLPEFHVVQRGDTLYSIAFRYGLDFRALAARNGIADPYTIHPGQKLRLAGDKAVAGARPATRPDKPAAAAPRPAAPVVPPAADKPSPRPAVPLAGAGSWQWPAPGRLLGRFKAGGIGPKGIAIGGNAGDPVRAARAGRVVYTGDSLVGYGQLVIIKHDDVYLSAYAHNSRLLVKEGDSVAAGDTIAEMGSTGTERTQLHFEVRRNGDPIDPLAVLPTR